MISINSFTKKRVLNTSSNGNTVIVNNGGESVRDLDTHLIFGQPFNGTQDVEGELNNVTNIDYLSFYQCMKLTNIIIGSNVTDIGYQAFQYCSSLTSITIKANTPPTLQNINALSSTNNCPIYVPIGSVDTYKVASGWSTYASRIQAIPTN